MKYNRDINGDCIQIGNTVKNVSTVSQYYDKTGKVFEIEGEWVRVRYNSAIWEGHHSTCLQIVMSYNRNGANE